LSNVISTSWSPVALKGVVVAISVFSLTKITGTSTRSDPPMLMNRRNVWPLLTNLVPNTVTSVLPVWGPECGWKSSTYCATQ